MFLDKCIEGKQRTNYLQRLRATLDILALLLQYLSGFSITLNLAKKD